MAIDKDKVITDLGKLLEDAVRTSVAKGAQYDPGEDISLDTNTAWLRVAKNLVKLCEVIVEEQRAVEKQHG
jgi:hypothetical protein